MTHVIHNDSVIHVIHDDSVTCHIAGGSWVGWAGPGLAPGDQVPTGDNVNSPTARLGGDQVCPVYLDQDIMANMYQHCRQVK